MESTRPDVNQWEWVKGRSHYNLRLFPDTQSLIWSVWAESSEGPQFGDGIKQTFERFLEVGVPDSRTVPDDLIAQVEARIAELQQETQSPPKLDWRFWRR